MTCGCERKGDDFIGKSSLISSISRRETGGGGGELERALGLDRFMDSLVLGWDIPESRYPRP